MAEKPPYILLRPDGTPLADPILGKGGSGVVVQRDGTAVKLPLVYRIFEEGEYDRERLEYNSHRSQECIKNEKQVLQRLGQCDGVVPCLDLTGPGIQMELMENGILRDYLRAKRPAPSVLLSWIREMARALVLIHERRVIVADITSGSFLLNADLSIKFSDFAESIVLPLDTDMDTVDDNGYSIYTDIGRLGAVIYEITTGKRSRFDLFKHQSSNTTKAAMPPRNTLPSTKNILLGEVIEKCWTKDFVDEYALLASLDSAILEHSLKAEKKVYSRLGSHRNIARGDMKSPCVSLDTVLLQQNPDWMQRLTWVGETAKAIAYAHSKRVVIANVAAPNFVINSKGFLRLYNFSDARIIPRDTKFHKFDDNGFSIKNDVVCYGSLVYHIMTGRRPEFSINKRGDLLGPGLKKRLLHDLSSSNRCRDGELPTETDQAICDIIWNCWTKDKYKDMKDVCRAVSQFDKTRLILHSIKVSSSSSSSSSLAVIKLLQYKLAHGRRVSKDSITSFYSPSSFCFCFCGFGFSYFCHDLVATRQWHSWTDAV